MPIPNVSNILFYDTDELGQIVYPSAFQANAKHGFEPDGVGCYAFINGQTVANSLHGNPFLDWQPEYFAVLQDWIAKSARSSKTMVVGLEPRDPSDPYGFVIHTLNHTHYFIHLASAFGSLQDQAKVNGKRLNIVIRYASEMNDRLPGNPWGQQLKSYRDTFNLIRGIFAAAAPAVRFAFSPALRADLDPAYNHHPKPGWDFDVQDYLPHLLPQDYISCTWYAGDYQHKYTLADGITFYRWFARYFGQSGHPLGIDEIGVVSAYEGQDRQGDLEKMVEAVADSAATQPIDYVSFFLAGNVGNGISLAPYA